ncbi:MAG TPA: RNA 2',3'-cyclic phosphodiesterase [Pyrinomonadaceae bacterium]|jgi:2'-5' RNA ligase|nr:RNA 2',3'-cyclic phosphodiesterase [Pyrinomonadaceae bacterium]
MSENLIGIEGRLRLFFAVELPEEVRARAAEHAARLRRSFPDVRAGWERPEKMHVTLKFLGDVDAARVASLRRAAEVSTRGLSSFTLTVEGTGSFPPRGAPRVIWLGLRDTSGQLARLQSLLEQECEREGFPREPRPFKPHLTLARIRTPHGARELAAAHADAPFGPLDFNVPELLLIHSQLGPGGSRYTPISRHPLR